MTVGQRIRQKRIEKGLTQEELAQKMGYSGKTSVSAAENCGDNITTTKVRKFAEALGVTFRYLMGYEDEFGRAIDMLDELRAETEEEARARRIVEYYKMVDPEIQDAVETLLKSSLRKS